MIRLGTCSSREKEPKDFLSATKNRRAYLSSGGGPVGDPSHIQSSAAHSGTNADDIMRPQVADPNRMEWDRKFCDLANSLSIYRRLLAATRRRPLIPCQRRVPAKIFTTPPV